MIRSGLLNGLLAVQVILSMVLTGALMFRTPVAVLRAGRPQLGPTRSEPASAPDLVQPDAIWVHGQGGQFVAVGSVEPLYQLAWRPMRQALVRALARDDLAVQVSRQEAEAAAQQPMLGAELPLALPVRLWLQLWEPGSDPMPGPRRPDREDWRNLELNRVAFALDSPGSVFLLGREAIIRLPLFDSDRDELLRRVREVDMRGYPAFRLLRGEPAAPGAGTGNAGKEQPGGPRARAGERAGPAPGGAAGAGSPAQTGTPPPAQPGAAAAQPGGAPGAPAGAPAPAPPPPVQFDRRTSPWVLVPANPQAATPLVEAQEPVVRTLLTRLFPDESVVRQMQEQDGAVYTDGQRTLRIRHFGALEYTASPDDGGAPPPLPEALQVASDFLTSRGLWPGGAVLSGYELLPGETRLTFTVRGPQLPWVSLRQRPLAEVRVAGDQVVYLYRAPDYFNKTVADPETLMDAEEAVRAVRAGTGDPDLVVNAIRLAHRVQATAMQSLIPVWVVGLTDGSVFTVDARNGRLQRQ